MLNQLLHYTTVLTKGLPVTLSLSFAAISAASIMAIAFTLLLTTKNTFLVTIVKGYIVVFTGTPLLVQLFLIYYGPAQYPVMQQHAPLLWQLLSTPWCCAFLTLTLNSAAYTTQIFYGALKSVPKGLWQACAVLGMNQRTTLKIIVPYALKHALSSYSNEVIFVVKGTALASTITLMDVMGYTQFLNGEYYDFSIFIITGAIYLFINSFLSIGMRLMEKNALQFENPQ